MNQLEGKTVFAVSFKIAAKDEKQARELAAKCRGVVLNTIKITPVTAYHLAMAKKPAKKTATAKKPAKVAKKPAKK